MANLAKVVVSVRATAIQVSCFSGMSNHEADMFKTVMTKACDDCFKHWRIMHLGVNIIK